ncbi:hypothetical protein C4D60_Mb09t23320 [Musa balbisiana]|uniref:Uncharacterized protein n=1 Tax=Musa balbisiana TaxID=52838 RepID=A0A4S8IKY4_MUSBA|nr:hypothetical protein C4D60_Mb09t23320 [Musa balbisiana]
MEPCSPPLNPFAAAASPRPAFASALVGAPPAPALAQGKRAFALAHCPDYVAKTLAGTAVYTVQLRQPILGKGARVVAMTLDQVYMLKVEGIGFRFLPDPLQIKNALALADKLFGSQLKSAIVSRSFDGVPVFQEKRKKRRAWSKRRKKEEGQEGKRGGGGGRKRKGKEEDEEERRGGSGGRVHVCFPQVTSYGFGVRSDFLVKKKNKQYCPIYFQKEDIETELLKVSKASRGSEFSHNIMVVSLEGVLKKVEMNDKNSG